MNFKQLIAAAAIASFGTLAQAALITNGFTFTVASPGGNTTIGSHYHSNTGGAFGNPAGKAEVGRYFSEGVRGLSEYNLTGLGASASAFVTFNTYRAGGLFAGANDFPFTGTIAVDVYQGDNAESISDYQAASLGNVFSFSTVGLAVGDILSFDITSYFNTAITNGWNSLGIRLIATPLNDRGAWTFDSFRLTSTNDCTPGTPQCGGQTPEPGSLALLSLAFLAAVAAIRRRGA